MRGGECDICGLDSGLDFEYCYLEHCSQKICFTCIRKGNTHCGTHNGGTYSNRQPEVYDTPMHRCNCGYVGFDWQMQYNHFRNEWECRGTCVGNSLW